MFTGSRRTSIDFKKPRDPRLRVQHFVMPHPVGHQSPWTNLILEFNRNIEISISLQPLALQLTCRRVCAGQRPFLCVDASVHHLAGFGPSNPPRLPSLRW